MYKCIYVYIFSYSRELCEEGIMEEFVRKRMVRRVGGYGTLVQSVRTLLLVGTVHPYDTCVQCVQQARAVCTVCAYSAYLMCVCVPCVRYAHAVRTIGICCVHQLLYYMKCTQPQYTEGPPAVNAVFLQHK